MSSEPPEEPHLRAEPSILSPTSPKPIHIPTPTNIPVLEMQLDVGYNQTEPHMSDPSMHNTDVRPDFWRDPNEPQQQVEEADHASPYSTGGEAMQNGDNNGQDALGEEENANSEGTETAHPANAAASEPAPISISASLGEAYGTEAEVQAQPDGLVLPSSEPTISVPESEAASAPSASLDVFHDPTSNQSDPAQQSHVFTGGAVDVQALLDTLQPAAASTAPQADSTNTLSPSYTQQAPPPGVDSTTLSSPGLGAPSTTGLPPRPPPQEQPLIHPNYVHSQHIRDYHPHAAHPAFQPHARSDRHGTVGGNVADPNSRTYVPPVHSPGSGGAPSLPGQSTAPGTGGLGGGGGGSFTASPTSAFGGGAPNGHNQQPPAALPQVGSYSGHPPAYAGSPTSATSWGAPQTMYNPSQSYSSSMTTPNTESRRENPIEHGRHEDRPWDAEVQRKYDRFIEDERRYVSEGRWEQFPQGSRLFVGNLSSEKVTKRDIFHVFHPYGHLAQISIKQAYGFVQFLRTEDCMRALEAEQGTLIRDKRIHLEVSKPQKNRTQNQNNAQRRSRSPQGRQGGGGNVDRYVSGGSGGRGGNNRTDRRDGYRPGYRSPSPRGYRDRYDDRRSRSPGYGGRGRYRSPSPRRRDVDDDLPLPRRERRDVPDVQIIVLDPSLERDFINWVENAFKSRSVRAEALLLSPRLSEQAVVRRQILEGVVAVVKLKRENQNSGKIGLQIFDRRQGQGNVSFEEYDGLDPGIAVELVLRAMVTHGAPNQPSPQTSGYYGGQPQQQYGGAPPPQQQYGGTPGYTTAHPAPYAQPPQPPSGYPPTNYTQQPAPGVPPHLQSLITNLDPNNIQSLLGSMGTSQSGSANPYGAGAGATPTNSAVQQQLQNNPALAGYLQQQQGMPGSAGVVGGGGGGVGGSGGGQQVNMQEILARLGSYQR